MTTKPIVELVQYGIQSSLITEEDRIYCTNQLLEMLGLSELTEEWKGGEVRPLSEILEDLLDFAAEQGLLEQDTTTYRDLFDTKLMNVLTPRPSEVNREFRQAYQESPKQATDYYYGLSKATNYIRVDRVKKDEKWTVESQYGTIDITINLSKPEKDPREIAKAKTVKASNYPKCLLCKENVGYAGNEKHPARQNHRILPIRLAGVDWSLQYSPYVYYNEHCILLNNEHTPMKISKTTFLNLLAFVKQFPHYFIGSNADLPIVGGSILTHDHYQGGCYEFAMAKAPSEYEFVMDGYEEVEAAIVKWPMSVIRLKAKEEQVLIDAADHILQAWREYTDEDAFIFAQTEGVPHNTITPIARYRDGKYELDLVLRNNITTEEAPLGVYHPRAEYHHIKKENIGLIEVMGLAVLPARLKKEMELLAHVLVEGEDLEDYEQLVKHKEWVEQWRESSKVLTEEECYRFLQAEIGKVFVGVLEDAGVYKCTPEGRSAFLRFLTSFGCSVRKCCLNEQQDKCAKEEQIFVQSV